MKTPGRRELVTVVGTLPVVNVGEFVEARGRWSIDPKYGMQFKAETLQATPPTTADGIRRYLASGLVRGIGPEYAARLVAAFGARVFDIIEHEPETLATCRGIGDR